MWAIGWGGFLITLVGLLTLPLPYSSWAHLTWVLWMAACVAYRLCLDSGKSRADLVKNAVVACVVLGGLSLIYHGEPSYDEDGNEVSEGFVTTFDSKAGAGVKTFIKLFVGAYIGIVVAEQFSHKATRTDEVV